MNAVYLCTIDRCMAVATVPAEATPWEATIQLMRNPDKIPEQTK